MKSLKKRVGENVKRIREEAGLTQLAFAKKLGCGISTVQKWEAGDFLPRMSHLEKVAEIGKTSVEALGGFAGAEASSDARASNESSSRNEADQDQALLILSEVTLLLAEMDEAQLRPILAYVKAIATRLKTTNERKKNGDLA